MFGATVSTPLPLLLEVPLRLRLGLRLVPRYRYCSEFRALRLGSLLGLGLPVTAKARSRAIYIIAVLPIIIDIIPCNGIGNAARACIRIRIKSCEHSVLRW